MESTAIYRKPKKWIAAVLGLLIQPAGMLYVARPGWAAAYFALAAIIVLGNMFVLRGRESAGNAIALLVAIICAIHSYRLARDYRALKRPWYSRWYGLVGIVAAFAALALGTRAFLFEPFRFPSGSMTPSIEPRAHLIVKKWGYGNYGTYGVHLMRTGMSSEVQRGDIVVFEYPEDTALSYAKRVVGLPGDRISYYNKRLWINDQEAPLRPVGDYVHKDRPIRSLLFLVAGLAAAAAHGQSEAESTYSEVFYSSGNLRIQAYLYKPEGDGPFPVVIYNHGSRDGRERASVPFQYVGKMLTRAGYVVLVPERRGYGKSDGSMWRQDVGNDPSSLITR